MWEKDGNWREARERERRARITNGKSESERKKERGGERMRKSEGEKERENGAWKRTRSRGKWGLTRERALRREEERGGRSAVGPSERGPLARGGKARRGTSGGKRNVAGASAMRRGVARGVRHIESLRHAVEALSRAPTFEWVCCCRIEFPHSRAPYVAVPSCVFRVREAESVQ